MGTAGPPVKQEGQPGQRFNKPGHPLHGLTPTEAVEKMRYMWVDLDQEVRDKYERQASGQDVRTKSERRDYRRGERDAEGKGDGERKGRGGKKRGGPAMDAPTTDGYLLVDLPSDARLESTAGEAPTSGVERSEPVKGPIHVPPLEGDPAARPDRVPDKATKLNRREKRRMKKNGPKGFGGKPEDPDPALVDPPETSAPTVPKPEGNRQPSGQGSGATLVRRGRLQNVA